MSLELLYTSAEAGLRQGTRGFCTVLSTSGMPVNLATRLETLSGYRHVYSPQDALADQNPVCWSHVRLKLGGRSVSVLSRIAAYGVDYSGRTNKLAHHVAVETHELPPAGPAWLLSEGGIMRTSWDGQKATPPAGPAIPTANQPPSICERWRDMTGDAGWGGVVADAWASRGAKPQWVVYSLQQSRELLALVDESIALLPEAERWNATFSTYYTNLPPEIDCRVRFVLEGTEEARLAAARGSVINLARPGTVPRETPLVQLARSGPEGASVSAPTAPPTASTASVAAPLSDPLDEEEFTLAPLQPPVASAGSRKGSKPPAVGKGGGPPGLPRRRRRLLAYTIGTMTAVLLLVTVGVGGSRLFESLDRARLSAETERKSTVSSDVDAEKTLEITLNANLNGLFEEYDELKAKFERLELSDPGEVPTLPNEPTLMPVSLEAPPAAKESLETLQALTFSRDSPVSELKEADRRFDEGLPVVRQKLEDSLKVFISSDSGAEPSVITAILEKADRIFDEVLLVVRQELEDSLKMLMNSDTRTKARITAAIDEQRKDLEKYEQDLAEYKKRLTEIQRKEGENINLIENYLASVSTFKEKIKNARLPHEKSTPDIGELQTKAEELQQKFQPSAVSPEVFTKLTEQQQWVEKKEREADEFKKAVVETFDALAEQEVRRDEVAAFLESAKERLRTVELALSVDNKTGELRISGSKPFPVEELGKANAYEWKEPDADGWRNGNRKPFSAPLAPGKATIDVPDQTFFSIFATITNGDEGEIGIKYEMKESDLERFDDSSVSGSQFDRECRDFLRSVKKVTTAIKTVQDTIPIRVTTTTQTSKESGSNQERASELQKELETKLKGVHDQVKESFESLNWPRGDTSPKQLQERLTTVKKTVDNAMQKLDEVSKREDLDQLTFKPTIDVRTRKLARVRDALKDESAKLAILIDGDEVQLRQLGLVKKSEPGTMKTETFTPIETNLFLRLADIKGSAQ